MRHILLTVFSFFFISFSSRQSNFKTYTDARYHFSFSYPAMWKITPSNDTSFYAVCVPATKKEKELYAFCFNGIVFYMEVFDKPLDSTLLNLWYQKIGKVYITSDKVSDSVRTFKMSGPGWTGIYHHSECPMTCQDGSHHMGECEFLYFSNNLKTVLIESSAAGFDKDVFDKIKATFRFQ